MKILVVIDMQKDFIDGALGNKETKEVVKNVCKRVTKHLNEEKTPVIYTKDTHFDNYMETLEGKNLPVLHCIQGTLGYELVDELSMLNRSNSIEVKKMTFGAKQLPSVIKDAFDVKNESDTVITLCGVCTDICVISNALLLKAYFPEAEIEVEADCCAGVSIESHLRALEAMKMCQIKIV